ncbi:MAG: hypothetical protein ACLUKN_01230 [Bacilli bacterium]
MSQFRLGDKLEAVGFTPHKNPHLFMFRLGDKLEAVGLIWTEEELWCAAEPSRARKL